MKILIIFLLSITVAFAQNREAIQEAFQWNILNGSSTSTMNAYLSTIHPNNPQTVLDYFKSDKFILGWHWGGERIISKVMKVNQSDK